MLENDADPPCSVIASAAKQSRLPPRKDSGLLRCARNDGVETVRPTLGVIARLDRAIQYSETAVIESRSYGVLDSPPSRGMTVSSGEPAHTSYSVIASAAKQSRIPPRKDSGLLRCARNDGIGGAARQELGHRGVG